MEQRIQTYGLTQESRVKLMSIALDYILAKSQGV